MIRHALRFPRFGTRCVFLRPSASNLISRIPDFDFFSLNPPVVAGLMTPEEKIEVTAFDVATRIAGNPPPVAGNVKFRAHRKKLRVNGNGAGSSHLAASRFSNNFDSSPQWAGGENRQAVPTDFPAAAFLAGAIARGFHLHHPIGLPNRRRNPMTPSKNQQVENPQPDRQQFPEFSHPFHRNTLNGKTTSERFFTKS